MNLSIEKIKKVKFIKTSLVKDHQNKQQPVKWLFFLFKSSTEASSDVVFSKIGIWGIFTNFLVFTLIT